MSRTEALTIYNDGAITVEHGVSTTWPVNAIMGLQEGSSTSVDYVYVGWDKIRILPRLTRPIWIARVDLYLFPGLRNPCRIRVSGFLGGGGGRLFVRLDDAEEGIRVELPSATSSTSPSKTPAYLSICLTGLAKEVETGFSELGVGKSLGEIVAALEKTQSRVERTADC